MSEDNRVAPRQRTLKGGKIVLNDGFSTIDCTVRNLSATGAKLEVASIIGIPPQFRLAMNDGRDFSCETAWRTESAIGVKFI